LLSLLGVLEFRRLGVFFIIFSETPDLLISK